MIELGRISEGVGVIERYIAAREASGDRTAAAIARVLLAEVYIQIRAGGRKAPAAVIARNLRTLAGARLFGARRAHALLDTAASHEQLSREGAVIARIDFDRGQLLEMRGKRAKARGCFERARKIAGVQGLDALRRRSEAALARLG